MCVFGLCSLSRNRVFASRHGTTDFEFTDHQVVASTYSTTEAQNGAGSAPSCPSWIQSDIAQSAAQAAIGPVSTFIATALRQQACLKPGSAATPGRGNTLLYTRADDVAKMQRKNNVLACGMRFLENFSSLSSAGLWKALAATPAYIDGLADDEEVLWSPPRRRCWPGRGRGEQEPDAAG